MDERAEILKAVNEIRDLLQLIAEPQIAQRDKKMRDELRRIVGKSEVAAKAVQLMDGTRNQTAIRHESKMHQGNLSSLVKKLNEAGLVDSTKEPKLKLAVPSNFFEATDERKTK